MTTFDLTFGQRYRGEDHPTLGSRPDLPDGWLTVEADDYASAAAKVANLIGDRWCSLYEADGHNRSYYPLGDLGPLADAVAQAKAERCECFEVDPKYWTTYGSSVEPGSTHEWNPDCPVHKPTRTSDWVPVAPLPRLTEIASTADPSAREIDLDADPDIPF